MPELPEVETVRLALATALRGRSFTAFAGTGADLRVPIPLAALRREAVGREVASVRRRAKYLVVELAGARAILLHLGMTGSLSVVPADTPPGRHDHLRARMDDGGELRFTDPRRFGSIACCRLPRPGADPDELGGLGPEPLTRAFSANHLFRATRRRRQAIKPSLLDQTLVAGVGNIYASEALHRARIHPERPADGLAPAECGRLVRAVKAVLRSAVRQGGSTVRNYRSLNGTEGRFQRALRVYGRTGQPCPACRSPIAELRQAGRSTFLCPYCQK